MGAGRTTHAVVGLALSGLLVAGCTSGSASTTASFTPGSDPSTAPASSSAAPSRTASRLSNRQIAVAAAYKAFWRALPAASTARSQRARLASLFPYATDPELSQVVDALAAQEHDGKELYGRHVAHLIRVQVRGDEASVFDCQDASHAGVAARATHKRLTVGVAHNPVRSSLVRRSGRWKVSTIRYP
jgi:hypothetical protein